MKKIIAFLACSFLLSQSAISAKTLSNEDITALVEPIIGSTTVYSQETISCGWSKELVLKVQTNQGDFVLSFLNTTKFPDEFIAAEFLFTHIASDLDVAPKVFWSDLAKRAELTHFIQQRNDLDSQEKLLRVADVLKKLHTHHFDKKEMAPFFEEVEIIFYPKLLEKKMGEKSRRIFDAFMNHYFDVKNKLDPLLDKTTFIHGDLHNKNILFDDARAWLVDFEYSGVSDAYFDLIPYMMFNLDDDQQELSFLEHYFGKDLKDFDLKKFIMAKQISCLVYAMAYLLKVDSIDDAYWDDLKDYRFYAQKIFAHNRDYSHETISRFAFSLINEFFKPSYPTFSK